MRQDQFEKLQALEEKLLDVFLSEATPEKWPGHGIEPASMDQQTRGDRYWCKKGAVATLSLAQRVAATVGQQQISGLGTAPPAAEGEQSDQLDDEISKYEKEAAAIVEEMQRGSKKAAFDGKVHRNKR